MTDYGHSGSGSIPGTFKGGEGQLGNKSGKGKPGFVSGGLDSEFDPLTAALRQMHDNIANEPVPDDFLDLLDQIDAKMSANKKFS
jgi:hypothetical protein